MTGLSSGNTLVRYRSRSLVSCAKSKMNREVFRSHQDTLCTDRRFLGCTSFTLPVERSQVASSTFLRLQILKYARIYGGQARKYRDAA
jgi:hypothetical protein